MLRHKWYVLIAGWRLQVPFWRLLVHDLSKLTPAEFGPYARHFYGKENDPCYFTVAWHFHKLRNDHHWEYWVSVEGNIHVRVERHRVGMLLLLPYKRRSPADDAINPPLTIPSVTVLPMPLVCVREMIADWFAAGRAYNGAWPDPNNYKWYKTNRPKMHLHPTTEAHIDLVLTEAKKWEW